MSNYRPDLYLYRFEPFLSQASPVPRNGYPTPPGQFGFLQNWPEGGLHWALGILVCSFCLYKLCMLQQEHLHLIIFTLIIFGPASSPLPRPLHTHTHTHTHTLTFGAPQAATDRGGSGWSRALGSWSVFSFVLPASLTQLFLYLLFISCLVFYSFIQISTLDLALSKCCIAKQY